MDAMIMPNAGTINLIDYYAAKSMTHFLKKYEPTDDTLELEVFATNAMIMGYVTAMYQPYVPPEIDKMNEAQISRRDFFAGHAMDFCLYKYAESHQIDAVAAWAYIYSDAMVYWGEEKSEHIESRAKVKLHVKVK